MFFTNDTLNLIIHIIIVKVVAIIPIIAAIDIYKNKNSNYIRYLTIILGVIILFVQFYRFHKYRSVTSKLVILFMVLYSISLILIGINISNIYSSNRMWIAFYLILFSHLFEIVDIIDFRMHPFIRT